MVNHLNSKEQSQEGAALSSESDRSDKESLLSTISELDRTFSEDRGWDMGGFFAEDARLMFPHMNDIVGRDSIREAFVVIVSKYTTNSWSPKRELIDVHERRAYTLGSFIEIRTPLDGGPTEKLYGRLLEIWQLSSDDKWEIICFMTGRYADTELLG
ncbi:MAG: YybH family protein [Candidatus Thorarchaeota archaeon]|jgi:ketosteroid isomerase-like protein